MHGRAPPGQPVQDGRHPIDATETHMHWLEHKIPPPVVGATVALLMWLVAPLGPVLTWDSGTRVATAVLLVAVGLGFDLGGLLAFRAARTTINPLAPQRASALVTGGVYRLTRNPMYVGMGFLLLAWAVQLAAVLPFLGPLVFGLYINRFQILPEERVLRQVFGAPYAQYMQRVRRWL